MNGNLRCHCIDSEWGYEPGREDVDPGIIPRCFAIVGPCGDEYIFTDREGLRAYVQQHRDDTWVAWAIQAELSAMLAWDIEPPPKWIDLMIAYRYETNTIRLFDDNGIKTPPVQSGLLNALDHYKLPFADPEHKDDMRKLALRGPQNGDELLALTDYCMQDAKAVHSLLDKIPVPAPARLWSEFLRVVPHIQREGMPFDVATWDLVRERSGSICRALMDTVNREWPLYEGDSFRVARFAEWIHRAGLADRWPRTNHGNFEHDHDLLRDMEAAYPFLGLVRQCEDTRNNLNKRELAIDRRTGKHHHALWPFGSTTGRNQPKGWLPGCPKWMRYLTQPFEDHVLLYVDFTAQEFALAAAVSGDATMVGCYQTPGDPYINFGVLAGLCPLGTPKSDPIRDVLKVIFLAQLYGQGFQGVALRLRISNQRAAQLVQAHTKLFPRFHEWRHNWIDHAVLRGGMYTRLGWRVKVSEPRPTTIMNFPIQAGGAEILRLAAIHLFRSGFVPCALIHDAVMLHVPIERIAAAIAAVDGAFQAANRTYAPEVKMRWKAEKFPDRWNDASGLNNWNRVQDAVAGRVQ